MADTNPFDALDDSAAGAAPEQTQVTSAGNPFDALDEAPAHEATADRMQEVTDQAQMPEVTVSAKRARPEASWSQVASGIPTAIGAGVESKVAGAQEFLGRTAYDDARKKFWQATILPQAVRDAKQQNVALTDLPEVQDTARHLGIRPDTFTRDWPSYVNEPDDKLNEFKTQQRDRIQAGAQQIASGTRKRLTAQQVRESYAPNMDEHSLKSLVFDAATMAPDVLAGVAGTVATGGAGGAAIMAADIAPNMYAEARNRGLDHDQASTYAVLSTLASSVPEVPVLKIVENTPFAKKVIGGIVGEKLASTGVGKVAGTAAAQGVTQSVVNALQQGIDAGVLNEHLPLNEALKQVAWSGLVGSVVGAPMGAYHAATSREGKPTTFRDIPEVGGGNGVNETAPGLAAGEVSAAAEGPSSAMAEEPPQEVNRASEAKPEGNQAPSVAPPSMGVSPAAIDSPAEQKGGAETKKTSPTPEDERAALEAVKAKTVTPPQTAMLEELGLVRRNDLGEPMLLPKGRRRITQLRAEEGREIAPAVIPTEPAAEPTGSTPEVPASEGEKPAEIAPVEAKNEPEEPVSPPEPVNRPSKSTLMEEKPAEVPKRAALPPSERASALQKRLSEDENLRAGLTAMKGETGWAQIGGRVLRDATTDQVTGRTTWIPNAEWWPGRPKGLKESEVHAAVDKAIAGQPLRKREVDLVEYMADVHAERTAMAQTHQELQRAVPDLKEQPPEAVDMTLLAERAGFHDVDAAMRVIDTWQDDKPETIARVRGELEQIIGRGHSNKESLELTAQDGGSEQSAPPARAPAALDLFGEDRTGEQALVDETRRRDAARSPNRDVPVETGLPGDLFSQSRRQVDFTDQLKQARKDTETEPTKGQKEAGNYAKGKVSFGGMTVSIENPKGSTRTGVDAQGRPWSSKLAHDYGYINRTEGHDGDHVDIFLTGRPDTGKVFVVNQIHPDTGKFDEHKAIGGAASEEEARATYEANYPKGWKGAESIAEFSTPDFRKWVHSEEPARGPIRPPSQLERRTAAARRAKVSEMTPEQLRKELLTHELTAIPNRRAYVESEKLPAQVSIDVDSLKAINDIAGHHAGDELLKAVGQALQDETEHAYHLSGDEFAIQALHPREANAIMGRVAGRLKDAEIIVNMPDGRVLSLKGLGVSFGVGEDLAKADAALQSHKKQREAEGSRAPRGEAPPGLTFRPAKTGREDRGRTTPTEKERSVVPTKAARDRAAAAAKLFSDSATAESVAHHGLNTLDVERQREVLAKMRAAVQDPEIFRRVVESVPVSVMDVLASGEQPADRLLSDPAMLAHRLTVAADGSIPGPVRDVVDAVAKAVTGIEPARTLPVTEKTTSQQPLPGPLKRRTTISAGNDGHVGLPRAHVERIVHQTIREANLVSGFPHVEVHEDVSTLPEHIKSLIEEHGAEGLTGAVYDPSTGRIHVIAGNNGSEVEVRENLWHEAVGHHGLRLAMDRPQYNAIMDGIARDIPERVEASARRNGLDLGDLEQKRAAAEEVVAYAAGQQLSGQAIDKPVLPYWKRAVRAVKAFFSRMAGKPFYDDQAIAGLVQQAHQALERGSIGGTAGEPLRSTRAPTYYSPVERAVTSSKQAKASADQWLATIKKMPSVKPEELEWLNLEPWLKEHKGPITREELADYVRANKLELHETQHGAGAQTEDERKQISLAEELRAEGYEVYFDNQGNLSSISVPFHHPEYSGTGTNEFRMSDPEQVAQLPETIRERVQRLNDLSSRVAMLWQAEREGTTEDSPDDLSLAIERGVKYGDYTLPGGQNYRELLLRLPDRGGRREIESDYQSAETARQLRERNAARDRESGTYRSSHWDEPNIVAHTRFSERTDAEGKKVLFIEEIQSDWHQQGRQRGYQDASRVAELQAQEAAAARDLERLHKAAAMTRRADYSGTVEEMIGINDEIAEASRAQQHAEDALIRAREGVPPAPFKTSWPMLAMKRMVRWAAEKGFDRIAWTTGDQQNERYDLAHHIGSLRAERFLTPEGERKYFLGAKFPEGGEVPGFHTAFHERELAEMVGQDMAAKITSQPEGLQVYSGIDLRVGGEGMRGFYDQILPRETDKLIKKYGGKVGKVTVKLDNAPDDVVEKWAQKDPNHPFVLKNRSEQHGFDITPHMRQAALGEGFPMFARRQQDLPLEENRERGAYAAVRRALNAVHESKAVRDVRKLGNPVGMSAESKQVAAIARSALGELAHETVQTQEALEHFSRDIDKLPITDQLEMMDAIERGAEQPHPELQPVADEMRKTLDTWREKVRGLGDGYLDNFIENYFPHYWRDASEAQRMVASIMGRRPLRGPASFLKMRTIPSIKEGMDAGLTPLTTNPLIMTLLKAREMQRFVTGVTLMRRFKEDGLARFLRSGLPMPDGWAPINDSIAKVRQWSEAEAGFIDRGQYIMPVDAARVINNHLSGSALRDFAPAQIFRRGANALNALQLGFSAFHLGFTTLDAMISKNAQGIERLMHGDVLGAVKSFGEGVTPVGAVRNVHRGYKLLEAYTNPAGATPDMQKLVKALELAGGRAHMDRYYLATEGFSPFRGVGIRSLASDIHKALTAPQGKLERLGEALGSFPAEYGNKLWRGMQEIWQTTPAMEVPIEVTARIVRASTAWIMEHLVPMQKLGVFSDLAADHLQRNPLEDPNARAAAMQRIWDSVDNRLGEMVYDNLFWNRTLKDTLHLGIRAVGWNLGTIREIGGAPVDLVKAINQKLTTGELRASDLGHRIPYVLAMTATTALYASIYQYLSTGQGPQELKDYFFPRTGGLTHYGTAQRVSLPSYVKDVYEYSQQPGTTVVNKLNPIFSLIGNLYSNQDFFGNPITDPEADYWHKKLQQLQFIGKEATPFSFQGRQQMEASEQPGGIGATVRKVLPMVGVTPAPGYITSPDQIERRNRLEQDKKYTQELKYKMKAAAIAKDSAKAKELAAQYVKAMKRMNQTEALVEQDRAKAAAARRKAAITMRQAGLPATANLVASLPLDPDHLARQYFTQQAAPAS